MENQNQTPLLTVVSANPFDRRPMTQILRDAFARIPDHCALRTKDVRLVEAYRNLFKSEKRSRKIEKLKDGVWILYKDVRAAEKYFREHSS